MHLPRLSMAVWGEQSTVRTLWVLPGPAKCFQRPPVRLASPAPACRLYNLCAGGDGGTACLLYNGPVFTSAFKWKLLHSCNRVTNALFVQDWPGFSAKVWPPRNPLSWVRRTGWRLQLRAQPGHKVLFSCFLVTEPCSMLVLMIQTSIGGMPRLRGVKASFWAYCSGGRHRGCTCKTPKPLSHHGLWQSVSRHPYANTPCFQGYLLGSLVWSKHGVTTSSRHLPPPSTPR